MTVTDHTTSDRFQRAHRQDASSRTLLADSLEFARVAYAGQAGEFGEPAIEHPLRVMASLIGDDTKIVALLHDTLAHSVATLVDLRALLPNRLLIAVSALGPVFEESEGIASQVILADPIARSVKLACIADLADPVRLAQLDPFTRRRRESIGAAAAQALGTTLPKLLATWNSGRTRT